MEEEQIERKIKMLFLEILSAKDYQDYKRVNFFF